MLRWKRDGLAIRGSVLVVLMTVACLAAAGGEARLRVEANPTRPEIGFLSWDTEGGSRVETNLLRSGQATGLQVCQGGKWRAVAELPTTVERVLPETIRYRTSLGEQAALCWSLWTANDRLAMTFTFDGGPNERIDGLRLVVALDPGVTPTTVLPSDWGEDGRFRLPAIISAPDFGQMLLSEAEGREVTGRLEGSRQAKWVDLWIDLPLRSGGQSCTLRLEPYWLPAPRGLKDQDLWRQARRGWFGALQPSARWGEQDRPYSAPAGVLANNVISDPASCSLWFYADQALWTPQLTPEISVAALVQRSLDWWLDHRMRPTGEMVCYWDYGDFLDADAGVLIAAWDYVEATGDTGWLGRRIEQLEKTGEFLARRDVDGDGIVEAVQSGNANTLREPKRSCAWFDAVNCGHKDGYTNALIYRAWRCLAELERRLDRPEQRARYGNLADRLKGAYLKTLFNPATGWLAWWKSEDGQLHDYAAPTINGLAIEYGLVEPELGRAILDRLWAKMEQVGFQRFDLGIPMTLDPVRRSDYLQPGAIGVPQREDGTDTLGHYMNGGITAGHVLHFLAAHYVVGRPEKADELLRAMLKRQSEGKFQNGVRDASGQGIDWTDWNGNATGYEGYLADSYRFLQSVLLRQAEFRQRYYGPLGVN